MSEEIITRKVFELEREIALSHSRHIGLEKGVAGESIFYYSLFRFTDNHDYLNKSKFLIKNAIDGIRKSRIDYSMLHGCSGILWAADFLASEGGYNFKSKRNISDIDSLLFIQSLRDVMNGDFDFWEGGLSPALYAIRRIPEEKSLGYIRQLISVIESYKILERHGIILEELIETTDSEEKGAGIVSITMSIITIVSILTKVYQKQQFEGKVVSIIDKGLQMIAVLARENSKFVESVVQFSYINIHSSGLPVSLLLAHTFFESGAILNAHELKTTGTQVLSETLKADHSLSACVSNPFLFGGTAGIAYMYEKLKAADLGCQSKHEFWTKKTINILDLELQRWQELKKKKSKKNFSNGMLVGLSGIGLTLAAPLIKDTKWDECLLLSDASGK